MKTFQKTSAQGDIFIRKVKSLPKKVVQVDSEDGKLIVTHSETGHHHYMDPSGVALFQSENDPMVSYLEVSASSADLIHGRSYDTHETLRLEEGLYEVRRQREWVPEGWRRVED